MPSAWTGALGKEIIKKNKKNFAECLGWGTQQSNLKKNFAECRPKHSVNFFYILSSAPIKSTRQRPFAEKNITERTLPSATLGKTFAECKGLFAECKNTRQSRGLQ